MLQSDSSKTQHTAIANPKHKVAVLLSGGKDSVYNACLCAALGHELVALATLSPPEGKEEMDSYMYQTVGQDGVHLIAQAMQLPLFRRTIKGTAVDQSLVYGKSTDSEVSRGKSRESVLSDETEDLYDLLTEVKAKHPEITAVSVGAILSNYQRNRVEHVCARLNLISLAFLWRQDQTDLLKQMNEAGMSCVVIKVAGAGLDTRHLCKDVVSDTMRQQLGHLHVRFGLHPCGEGGEYETFTVDCPLYHQAIRLVETEIVNISPEGADRYSTVAYLRIKGASLVPKQEVEVNWRSRLRKMTFAAQDKRNLQSIEDVKLISGAADAPTHTYFKADDRMATYLEDDCFSIINIRCKNTKDTKSPFEETLEAFRALKDQLAEIKQTYDTIDHINLYLASMDDFAECNRAYKSVFALEPPSRVCAAVQLPDTCRVMLDVFGCPKSSKHRRESLHVQSISTWAPANIGPYSQAVRRGNTIYIAGQIGLFPHTMQFPEARSVVAEARLGLKHVQSVLQALGDFDIQSNARSAIVWLSEASATQHNADLVLAIWSEQISQVSLELRKAIALPRGALVEWQIVARAHSDI